MPADSRCCPGCQQVREAASVVLSECEPNAGPGIGSCGRLSDALTAPCTGAGLPKEHDLAWATECLDMIREDLEAYGMSMAGCPPMMYNDAIRSLVSRLGRHAGLTTTDEVRAVVQAAERAAPKEG